MKVIKVLYNDDTRFIIDIVNSFKENTIIEEVDASVYKNQKKVREIQTNFGTKNFPLIIFEDENLDPVAGIWPESNPNWEDAIKTILDKL